MRSLPKLPLWPRGERTGIQPATARSSSSRMPPPPGSAIGRLTEPLEASQDVPLALVETGFDVDGEEEGAAGLTDAIGDGHGVFPLVADGDRDAGHAQLLGPAEGPAGEADGRLTGGQADDLDLAPAHAPDAQTEDLADRFLGRPASGERVAPLTDVGGLRLGQDPPAEARPEAGQGGPDALDLDDVDAELGRPFGRIGETAPSLGLRHVRADRPTRR